MNNNNTAYLGTGWSFPPTFDQVSGNVQLVSAQEDIKQSLTILLSTSLGERVMQPTYGCNLRDSLFETLTPNVASNLKEQVRTAILYHEPRIRLNQIDVSLAAELQGVAEITVKGTILSTNSRFSFVYPFYLREGAGSV